MDKVVRLIIVFVLDQHLSQLLRNCWGNVSHLKHILLVVEDIVDVAVRDVAYSRQELVIFFQRKIFFLLSFSEFIDELAIAQLKIVVLIVVIKLGDHPVSVLNVKSVMENR